MNDRLSGTLTCDDYDTAYTLVCPNVRGVQPYFTSSWPDTRCSPSQWFPPCLSAKRTSHSPQLTLFKSNESTGVSLDGSASGVHPIPPGPPAFEASGSCAGVLLISLFSCTPTRTPPCPPARQQEQSNTHTRHLPWSPSVALPSSAASQSSVGHPLSFLKVSTTGKPRSSPPLPGVFVRPRLGGRWPAGAAEAPARHPRQRCWRGGRRGLRGRRGRGPAMGGHAAVPVRLRPADPPPRRGAPGGVTLDPTPPISLTTDLSVCCMSWASSEVGFSPTTKPSHLHGKFPRRNSRLLGSDLDSHFCIHVAFVSLDLASRK